jgi:hypothetical protein
MGAPYGYAFAERHMTCEVGLTPERCCGGRRLKEHPGVRNDNIIFIGGSRKEG